jgi:hypothetical protein
MALRCPFHTHGFAATLSGRRDEGVAVRHNATGVGVAPSGGRWSSRVARVACCCLALSVGACAARGPGGHGDPDPGRAILAVLQPIGGALPDDATGVRRQDSEPQWSSCDGRPGTYGWTDVSVLIDFTTATPPDALISRADNRMVALGWTSGAAGSSVLGPSREWTRRLPDGTPVHALLTPWTRDYGDAVSWELTATAPPRGSRASGC